MPMTIYYFDPVLEGACNSIKVILGSIVGALECKYQSIPQSGDINPQHDFWQSSGLDMEVVL